MKQTILPRTRFGISLLLLCPLVVLGVASEAAAQASYGAVAARVLEGQTAPGTSGRMYTVFSPNERGRFVNDGGDIVFSATVDGPSIVALKGLFLSPASGPVVKLALEGEAVTTDDGGDIIFTDFNDASINDTGDVVFRGAVSGGPSGVFRKPSGAPFQAVARTGDVAPGTGGGTYTGISEPVVNDLGEVAFLAGVDGGTVTGAIFRTGSSSPVAAVGDPAPTVGGNYSGLLIEGISDAGHVAFTATGLGLFVDEGGVDGAIAYSGSGLPDGDTTWSVGDVDIAPTGEVVFSVLTQTLDFASGLFVDATTIHLSPPDLVPDTVAARYNGSADNLEMNGVGEIAFGAFWSSVPESGIFVESATDRAAVVFEGDPAPETAGFFGELLELSLNDLGQVAFRALIEDAGGNGLTSGIFVATPAAPAVPAFSPIALYTLVPGLLIGVGLAAMRRRRRC